MKNGVEVIVLIDQNEIIERHLIIQIIQEELTFDNIVVNSKQFVIKTIESMMDAEAEGVVLGCTELPLMIKEGDIDIPIFNTTEIHSQSAYIYILSNEKK